jgi:MFS family permease
MWIGAAYNLGSAMYDSLLVVFAVHVLHLTPTRLGLAVALGGAGFPIGSALSGRVNRRLGIGPALIAAAVPSVGGLVVAATAAGPQPGWFLTLGTLLVGVGQGCFAVNAITLRQFASGPEMRARATAVHRFVSWGALPVGSLAAGIIGQAFGIRTAVITAGVISASCFWPLLRSPLRTTLTPEDAAHSRRQRPVVRRLLGGRRIIDSHMWHGMGEMSRETQRANDKTPLTRGDGSFRERCSRVKRADLPALCPLRGFC